MKTCQTSIVDGGKFNTFGTVTIDGVRRLGSGLYQVRVHKSSENDPLFAPADYKTDETKSHWVKVSKYTPGNSHLPVVKRGCTVLLVDDEWVDYNE
jgi:hypothetical protein